MAFKKGDKVIITEDIPFDQAPTADTLVTKGTPGVLIEDEGSNGEWWLVECETVPTDKPWQPGGKSWVVVYPAWMKPDPS